MTTAPLELRVLAVLLCLTTTASVRAASDNDHPKLPTPRNFEPFAEERTTDFWFEKAQRIVAEKLRQTARPNTNRAKNIILFLGDGMSVHTITATRAFLGDSSAQLSFEAFPYSGLAKTYSVDRRVPDSAATATAYLTGVKANYGTIGVSAEVPRFDCRAANDSRTHTASLAAWAQDAGMWTGLVTTARVTHASPAGVYAHTANRAWEHDAAVAADGCSPDVNVDIARQLLEWPVGRQLRVVMGGGRHNFRDASTLDEEGKPGRRTDGRDLIADWLDDKRRGKTTTTTTPTRDAHYVWSKAGLGAIDLGRTEYLLGLFSASHCPYHGDLKREQLEAVVPSLSEMTTAAIEVLQRSPQGFFLFVEGAKIDLAHHETRAHRALEETEELARAVRLAREMTDVADTLIVVTSDHSHTMTINGYPSIFDLAPTVADDGLPYTILSYANGPSYAKTYSSKTGRRDLRAVNLDDPKRKFMATVPLDSETHGAEDVAVFASGPYEHYFTGNYEQSNIPALMAHAASIGPFQ